MSFFTNPVLGNFIGKKKFFVQFHIFLPNYSGGGYFLKMKQIKLKISFQNSFKSCKISTSIFSYSVILHKLSTTASSDQHIFGLIRRNINNISYES